MTLPKEVAGIQRMDMKDHYISTAIAVIALLACLGAPTVAAAHGHKIKVGNWGRLTLTNETKVGNLTLPPGRYLFEHRSKGADHYARFSRITWAVTSHYRVVGEVKCQIEPLPAKVKRTNVQVTHEDGVDRVTRIEVRGENVAHLF